MPKIKSERFYEPDFKVTFSRISSSFLKDVKTERFADIPYIASLGNGKVIVNFMYRGCVMDPYLYIKSNDYYIKENDVPYCRNYIPFPENQNQFVVSVGFTIALAELEGNKINIVRYVKTAEGKEVKGISNIEKVGEGNVCIFGDENSHFGSCKWGNR